MINKFEITFNKIIGLLEFDNTKQLDIGLLTGKSGIALLLANYCKLLKSNIYAEKIWIYISDVINNINQGYNYYTHCNGISGFCYTMNNFVKNEFININEISFLHELDKYLYKKMLEDLKKGNYDFLHGSIGVGLYFINHLTNPKSQEYLVDLIDELEKISIKDYDNTIKWVSEVPYDNNNTKKVFNLSLSHGMASIIAFLSKLYLKDISKKKVCTLLNGAVNYMLKQKFDNSVYGSNFPSWVCENELPSKSRLGWCYGDLGIGIALFQAAKATNNKEWENIALEVLLDSTKRRDLKKEGVMDAGICHGTAGIGHIYNRMWFNTRNEIFKEASDFWFEETLKMAKFEDGLAGYKAWYPEEYGGWQKIYGILEGIAGIGLALMSAISDEEPTWDECLLLS